MGFLETANHYIERKSYMDAAEFDRIMDMCNRLGFKNRDNMVIVPELASRLNKLLQSYIMLLCDDEEKTNVDEALFGLAMVLLLHEAKRVGLEVDKVIDTVDTLFGISDSTAELDVANDTEKNSE